MAELEYLILYTISNWTALSLYIFFWYGMDTLAPEDTSVMMYIAHKNEIPIFLSFGPLRTAHKD